MPKITKDLQLNLNRLTMQRTSECFFKLSTESPVSYIGEDIDEKAYVEGREFNLLNLGVVYLDSEKDQEKTDFIEDVFSRRFSAMKNYPVSNLRELVGTYNGPNFNEIAMSIRNGSKPEMWGKEVICDLCSGDIFSLLTLVKRMVLNAGGVDKLWEKEDDPKINIKIQRRAIREEAGDFLKNLGRTENGNHLVQVVTAFGNVAFSYLKFRNSKNEKENPPYLASRIELYERLDLSDEAQKFYDELLRYSLFIEDIRGKSRRGQVVPRLYLRRALLPLFNLTFSKRDSVSLENVEIESLLLKPQTFEKDYRLKKALMEDKQKKLFEDEDEDKDGDEEK